MIEVIVNRPSFEYDIHSLVKAFFPREDVQVRVQDTFTDETQIRMTVHFTDEQVTFSVTEDGRLRESGEQAIDYSDRKETKNHLKRLPEAFSLYRAGTSLGNADWYPSHKDCYGAAGTGKEKCGNCGIYEKYVLSQQRESGFKCYDCQPGTVCIKKY